MNLKPQLDHKSTLASFCQDRSLWKTKIALISFHNIQFPLWIEKIVLLVEYLQLISQALLLEPTIYSHLNSSESWFLCDVIVYFFKLINPCYLLDYTQSNVFTTTILLIVFCCTILKYVLSAYIIYIAYSYGKKEGFLVNVWRWAFKLQGRVMCFFVTSFWLRAFLGASEDEFSILGINKSGIRAISSLMIAFEYIFSFAIETQFCYVLPNKSFLSSKSYHLQVLTLAQKCLIQILQMILESHSISVLWLFETLNLILSCIRHYLYHLKLPLYSLYGLFFNGYLLSLVISLNIACISWTLLDTTNYYVTGINFIIVTSIILAILLGKLWSEVLSKEINHLILSSCQSSPELAVHRVGAIKQIQRLTKIPGIKTKKYDWTFLVSSKLNATEKTLFDMNLKTKLEKKTNTAKEIYLKYLEDLSTKFPKNSFVKLHIALVSSKMSQEYAKTIRIAADLRQSSWSAGSLTSSLLLYQIQEKIFARRNSDNMVLDLSEHIKNRLFTEEIKREILDQTELKIRICENLVGDVSDVGEISNCAHKIEKSKIKLQHYANMGFEKVPSSYIDPYHLYAKYSLILNYSLEEHQKYNTICIQKQTRCEKAFNDLKLTKDNLYQSTNAFLVLSGQKLDNGRIMFSTRSIENICGGNKDSYRGLHVSSLFTPSLQYYYSDMFRHILESNNERSINQVIPAYFFHKDKHLVEAEFYISIHPYVTEDLYLDMVIRPISSTREFILVKEDGDIEGGSKRISKILGINTRSEKSSSLRHIRLLSEELGIVNKAFNLVHKYGKENDFSLIIQKYMSEEKPNSSKSFSLTSDFYQRAIDLYDTYTSTGKVLQFTPIRQNAGLKLDIGYSYRCNISILPYGQGFMKLLTLDGVSDEEDENINKRQQSYAYYDDMGEKLIEVIGDKNNSDTGSANIDCPEKTEYETQKIPYLTDENVMTTQRGLLSPSSSKRLQFRLKTTSLKPDWDKLKENSVSVLVSNLRPVIKRLDTVRKDKLQKKKQDDSDLMKSRHSSQIVQEMSSDKAFQRAVTGKSYPRFFNLLCGLFYVIILCALFGQIILKMTMDSTMDDLVVKKNILRYAQIRSRRAMYLQIIGRGAGLQVLGALSVGDIPGINFQIRDSINLMDYHKGQMSDANQKIIEEIEYVDEDIKAKLFESDIRVHGSYLDTEDQQVKSLTYFQFIDEIKNIVGTLLLKSDHDLVSMQSYSALNFLAWNVLDDFLIKDVAITNLFLNSLEEQKDNVQNTTNLCLIISVILLASIALILSLTIWYLYGIGKSYMTAFAQLNSNRVKNILVSLRNFKKSLDNEEDFDHEKSFDAFWRVNISTQSTYDEGYHRRKDARVIKYSKIRIKYYLYVIKVVLYTGVLVGIIIWNFASTQYFTKIIYNRQSQLEFANYISTRVTIDHATFVELFASNNTNPVEHKKPLEAIQAGIAELQTILTQAPEKFLEADRTYDSDIQAILFTNEECKRFGTVEMIYCTIWTGIGQSTSLLSVIAMFEQSLKDKLQDYYDADKSTLAGIINAAYINIDRELPAFEVIGALAFVMSNIIDVNLTQSIDGSYSQRMLILIVFVVVLVIVSVLFWLQILKKLKEVNNDFKKVLQVFPRNLILSSLLLKTFLKKTSNIIIDKN